MSKTRICLLNAIGSLTHLIVLTVVGLVVTRTMIVHYGSDYNGINSTVIQIANSLMVLELGFVLASNVALFKPLINNDVKKINGILSATRIRFIYISILAFFIGIILSVIYPLVANTAMPKLMLFGLMLTVIVPVILNFGINMKYKALILASQKEYVISFVSAGSCIIGNVFAVILIVNDFNILVARVPIMVSTLLGYAYIGYTCWRKFPFVRYDVNPLFSEIKGTKDVIFLNIMSISYSSLPIIVISTLPDGGSLYASVYAVYRMISNLPAYALKSISAAPRLSFGALFAEGCNTVVKKYFEEYEMVICMALAVILGTTCIVCFPFIKLYTAGIHDISYINVNMALLVLSIIFIEVIHIPSGQIILMKGDFIAARKIQFCGCIIILFAMVISRIYFGYIGILASIFLAAVFLFTAEVYYTSVKILHRGIVPFFKNMFPALFVVICCMLIGLKIEIVMKNYVMFFFWLSFCSIIISTITFVIYFILKRHDVMSVLKKLLIAASFKYKRA